MEWTWRVMQHAAGQYANLETFTEQYLGGLDLMFFWFHHLVLSFLTTSTDESALGMRGVEEATT